MRCIFGKNFVKVTFLEITKELIWRKKFSVRVNFCNFHSTVWIAEILSHTFFTKISWKQRFTKGITKVLIWRDFFHSENFSFFHTVLQLWRVFFFKLRFHDFFIEDVFATEKNILMHSAEGTWFDVKPPIWMQDTHYLSWMISIRLFIILLLKQYVDIFYFINFIKHFKISHNLLMYCRYIKKKHVHCYARD